MTTVRESPPAVAVVPAAGRSRRMGRAKLLLPWGETTILGSTLAALREGGAEPVVVRGPADDGLALWLDWQGVRSVINAEPERGMLSSIQAGVALLTGPPWRQPLLVTPGDLPALRAASVRAVLEALQDRAAGDPALLAVSQFRDRQGHPLAIAPALIPEIATLDPAVGLRQLVQRYRDRTAIIEVDDPGTVEDVDTENDYQRLRPEP